MKLSALHYMSYVSVGYAPNAMRPTTASRSSQTHPVRNNFTTTRWSLVTNAVCNDSEQSKQALETLCRDYREPLLSYIRRTGYNADDAQDLTQQFFVHILTNNTLGSAENRRGKFRTFLLSCLKNFLINQHRHRKRIKRGGHYQFISYDVDDHLCQSNPDHTSPDSHFDKIWAKTVVENALHQLESEWKRDKKPFKQLKKYLTPSLEIIPFSQQAVAMGVSEAALKSAVYRMRQRYGQLVKQEVTATLSDPDDLDDEIRHLLSILSNT